MRSFLEITLKNGCFTGTNGVNVTEFKTYTVKGNGWECYIERSGRIFCRAIEGDAKLHYTIAKSGYARMSYFEKGKLEKIIKEGYVVTQNGSTKNGVIILSDGPIHKRYAFFRSESLQKFQNEYGIVKTKKVNPNTVYSVKNTHCNHLEDSGEVIPDVGTYCEIITDGNQEIIAEILGNAEKLKENFPNSSAYELEEMIEVKNATWVIKHIKTWNEHEVKEYRILYSLESYDQLDIPDKYKVI